MSGPGDYEICLLSLRRKSDKNIKNCNRIEGKLPFEAFRFVAAGKALTADPCQSRPCQNRGECLQLRYGRFRCECTGTGFYGDNCETGEFTTSAQFWSLASHNRISHYTIFPFSRGPKFVWLDIWKKPGLPDIENCTRWHGCDCRVAILETDFRSCFSSFSCISSVHQSRETSKETVKKPIYSTLTVRRCELEIHELFVVLPFSVPAVRGPKRVRRRGRLPARLHHHLSHSQLSLSLGLKR